MESASAALPCSLQLATTNPHAGALALQASKWPPLPQRMLSCRHNNANNCSYTCTPAKASWPLAAGAPSSPDPPLTAYHLQVSKSCANPTCSSIPVVGGWRPAGPRALRGGCVDSSLAGTLLLHGHSQSESQLRVQVGVHAKLIGVTATCRGEADRRRAVGWTGPDNTLRRLCAAHQSKTGKQQAAWGCVSPAVQRLCRKQPDPYRGPCCPGAQSWRQQTTCHICTLWTLTPCSPAAGAPSPPPPAANPVALSPWKIAVPKSESDRIIPGCTVTCKGTGDIRCLQRATRPNFNITEMPAIRHHWGWQTMRNHNMLACMSGSRADWPPPRAAAPQCSGELCASAGPAVIPGWRTQGASGHALHRRGTMQEATPTSSAAFIWQQCQPAVACGAWQGCKAPALGL